MALTTLRSNYVIKADSVHVAEKPEGIVGHAVNLSAKVLRSMGQKGR